MKSKKKSKILAALAAMMALSTGALVTSTFAWFTVNNSVNVTGMAINTKISSNLMIAEDTTSSTALKVESAFSSAPLAETVTGTLEPASTVNGHDYFYTVNATGTGDAKEDTYAAYTGDTAQADFATAYGHTGNTDIKPYVDYAFQLKAINTEQTVQDLKLTALELKYRGEIDENKAYRVAFSVENISASVQPTGDFKAIADGIYAPATAANHSDANERNYAVSAINAAPTQLTVTGNKYNSLTKLAEVPVATSSVPASFYKIIARLYLEGEDTTCTNSTFVSLTNSWDLSLEITLDSSASNVTALTMSTTPAPSPSGSGA